MAIVQGSTITTESIISRFKEAVVNPILSGAYHTGNIPFCNGYQCVPTGMMDHINNVATDPNIGNSPDIVSADVILNGLINIVRSLTRVGTFSFILYMRNSDTRTGSDDEWYTEVNSRSGKVVFTNAYIRAFGNPSDLAGTVYGSAILASGLNQLLTNIYNTWNRTSKEHYSGTAYICHSSCHYNCHSSCHSNCNSSCHGWI